MLRSTLLILLMLVPLSASAAIDTAEKRRSVFGVNAMGIPGVTPNVSKDGEWRQQVAYGYSGIAVGAGGGSVGGLLMQLLREDIQ